MEGSIYLPMPLQGLPAPRLGFDVNVEYFECLSEQLAPQPFKIQEAIF